MFVEIYVAAPEVEIVDDRGMRLSDKYYEPNSTIQLSCLVRRRAKSQVTWRHGDVTLNYGTLRGGIRYPGFFISMRLPSIKTQTNCSTEELVHGSSFIRLTGTVKSTKR